MQVSELGLSAKSANRAMQPDYFNILDFISLVVDKTGLKNAVAKLAYFNKPSPFDKYLIICNERSYLSAYLCTKNVCESWI